MLVDLESVAGWKTTRRIYPKLIPGSLDGIETGIRQLILYEPLETVDMELEAGTVTVPAEAEMMRIKAVLILKRNAVRDYLDFAALGFRMDPEALVEAV